MEKDILLSLCIPTYGVTEWVLPVVESIYSQGCDNSLFEVIITDNGKGSKLGEALRIYIFDNLHYYHTSAIGFTNQIEAFKRCNGIFCKILNHRMPLIEGALSEMIRLVNQYKQERPILYFSNGRLQGKRIIECSNIDEFCSRMSYWTSWSAGTCVWQQDLKSYDKNKVCKMFPHMEFLFELRDESKYVIWNQKYEIETKDYGKGGYDIFHTFGVDYMNEMHKLLSENRISKRTYNLVRKDLLGWLSKVYCREYLSPYTIHQYIINDVRKSLSCYYTIYEYYIFKLMAWKGVPRLYLHYARYLHRNIFCLLYDRFVRGKVIHDTAI